MSNKDENKNKNIFSDITNTVVSIKNEYKKIVWPSFKELCSATCMVLFACIIFGLLIFILDISYGFCFKYIIKYLV